MNAQSSKIQAADIRIETPTAPTANTPPQPLDPGCFPHPATGGRALKCTKENIRYLLEQYEIDVRFDVITKQVLVTRQGKPCSTSDITSLAILNGIYGSWLDPFVADMARDQPVNPVRDWIEGKPWDGDDRLPQFYATVQAVEGYPTALKERLLYRWLLSTVAAACIEGKLFSSRGVLTLQGGQGIGKTSWITALMPPGPLRDAVLKRDHYLDGGSKDSVLGAIKHWIVEIGELDGSFRKGMARMKGFLTNDCDKVRPPYGRVEVEWPRRTVFAATVNDTAFLVDTTGNSRFWTIAVEKLDYTHGIDMQQLFAQLKVDLDDGVQWWLTADEEAELAAYNQQHRVVSAIEERIRDYVALGEVKPDAGLYMSPIELLREIGIGSPSNGQCKECGQVLRELYGAPKRINGRDKWRVVPRSEEVTGLPPGAENERFS